MRLFKSDIVDWVLQALKMPDDVPIENKRVTASIASAQISRVVTKPATSRLTTTQVLPTPSANARAAANVSSLVL